MHPLKSTESKLNQKVKLEVQLTDIASGNSNRSYANEILFHYFTLSRFLYTCFK